MGKRKRVKIFGFCMVRDEADIVGITVLHHLSAGVDHILLVDNGSSDRTPEILNALGRDPRVTWWRDDSPWHQGEMLTELAREALRRGADWVVPFDADEFWVAQRADLRRSLAGTDAHALRVPVLNFIQARDRGHSVGLKALMTMTRRADPPVGPWERCHELVEANRIAFVEMMYPPKFVSRPTPEIEIAPGNHGVEGVAGPVQETEDLCCLHAPLRSLAALRAKAANGRRHDEVGWPPGMGWHARRFARLERDGLLEPEWNANSYEGDTLDVYGEAHPVVFDPALRDAVARLSGARGVAQKVLQAAGSLVDKLRQPT